ncbi:DUF6261 family protein [Parabacteroides sp. AGMB00274]|uniref:DUF6261 family protein n=1 Tax=Parabacteroides faecalis TaxID=2924040 RepID=A0ABT0C2K4_9BACT|nr:DUF6261 family protein [Parabacteroides faecalis]MCI7285097.1 DUF6261 family protein [Parabacteroides sp.]MCJ2381201.1 DUF6261 family protein [Parabacteroides faecalis]MDD6951269.1 DUF6261 family protein [Parabacteroides sp.]MDY6254849.1 DUF6261 family protein [Bacteroidales bacterium]
MSNITKIEGSSCQRYSNALHVGFHQHILVIFETLLSDVLAKLHISEDLLNSYKKSIDQESELNRKSLASTLTITMDEEEAERDRLLSMLFFLVANALASSKAATKAAAQRLDVVLRPYKGIQNQADDAETALIRGLLGDLRKEENTEAVTALNLEPTLASLETTNNAFDQAKNKRAEENSTGETETTVEVRKKTDSMYQDICTLVYASALMATGDEDREFCVSIINEMNRVIANYKTSYKQSLAQKEARKKKEEGDTTGESDQNPEGGEGGDLEFVPVDYPPNR